MDNFYINYIFFAEVLIAIIIYRNFFLYRKFKLPVKQFYLISLSIFFISQLRSGFTAIILTLLYCSLIFMLCKALRPSAIDFKKGSFFFLSIIFSLTVLLIFKYPNYFSFFPIETGFLKKLEAFHWIGLSYLTFRAINYLVQVKIGRTKKFDLSTLLLYLLYFAPFISGPINRYLPFEKDISSIDEKITFDRLRKNLARASAGIIKLLFLSKLAFYNSIASEAYQDRIGVDIFTFIFATFAYYFYIYLEFSGYCDVAIVISDFFGIRIPENFNYPFFASNIQDFWNRWHITLSHFIKDFFFFPVLKSCSERFLMVPLILKSCTAIFASFILVGIWHGDELNWFLYGCYHGAGLSALMLYRFIMKKYLITFYMNLKRNILYRCICIFMTFNFISISFLLTLDLPTLKKILHNTEMAIVIQK